MPKMPKMPSIKAVAEELRLVKPRKGDYGPDREGFEGFDVRLQVYDDGHWAIRTGDSSYDQDHRGYWGASSIDHTTSCRELAVDLIDQAAEHAAQVN
jgi:hypothetical protein